MNIDLSLNRVYWEYVQNRTWSRPSSEYLGSSQVPSIGARVTVPPYKKKGKNIKEDLEKLVFMFAEQYKDFKFVLALSGGIDSEITAETFYKLGVPFRAISQSLFDGTNRHDIMYAVKYCKDRGIKHHVLNLSYRKMLEETIPDAIKHGEFTHSYSQIALTNIFSYIKDDEIAVFSGHNPDFHRGIGVGWWEDSPNIVKYAIRKKQRFFTFTSLEPIFCHYADNFDGNQPGDKDNDFIYQAYPHLTRRVKMTGWENNVSMIPRLETRIRYLARNQHMTYLTWDYFTLNFMRQLYLKKAIK